jgi:predicted acylesterase/phospholipase RssA
MCTTSTPEGNPSLTKKLELINQAREVLRGKHIPSAALTVLYQDLIDHDQFSYAAEILLEKMDQDKKAGVETPLKEFQTLAKYIYKDHSLPSSFKFEKALQVLGAHTQLESTKKSETLGLTGAIYKRKWQFDHQYKNLVLSCYYYRRGYEYWLEYRRTLFKDFEEQNDDGFTAINYAYINELMGVDKLEERAKTTGITAGIINKLKEAQAVREEIIQQFVQSPGDPGIPVFKTGGYPAWVIATTAEAYFGLHKYVQAAALIEKYIQEGGAKPWEIRTFSQQLFSIAYLQLFQQQFLNKVKDGSLGKADLAALTIDIDEEKLKICLALFATTREPGEPPPVPPEIKRGGKLGLALSGGGFRASFFHIGVLAALAEKDELRHVQVISCVSGGSIIGAYYYLKLKRLLETKGDDFIEPKDYIEIVQEIEQEFTAGVQQNLRMRVFNNILCNLNMLRFKKYSRTHRMGELYDKFLFNKAWKNYPDYKPKITGKDGTISMNDLYITPQGYNKKFDLSVDNWTRRNKVPQLVLNATSVNTGHNWQFTASWMGEPPGNIQTDIDVKPRLRRMYYEEAPEGFKKFRLGYAVGASSCVPVMFNPMPLHGLYPGIDLQLIDGGLHDNQGIAALIEAECKNIIISDASGQLPISMAASNDGAATFYRADNILQERLRELQFLDIKERYNTTQLNTLITTHLKSDLQSDRISWTYCKDPVRKIVYGNRCGADNDLTSYGIIRETQVMLSEIRTDLDSFHDAEAKALIYSGYAQIHCAYKKTDGNAPAPQEKLWQFCDVKDYLTIPAEAAHIKKQLSIGKRLAFKVVYLSLALRVGLIVAAVAAAAGLLYLGYKFWSATLLTITVKAVVYTFIGILLGIVSKFIAALFSYKTTMRKYAGMIILLIAAWIFCNIYLWLCNPIYNRSGKLKRRIQPKTGNISAVPEQVPS